MGNEYSTQTLKVKSKMATARMQQHVSKIENGMIKSQRLIAELLSEDKEQSARIKCEGIIREDSLCRVMEWLEMMCDLIHQRVKQIELAKECPDDLRESICTILYCAKRIDIPELSEIGGQFKAKWGDKWFEANIENRSGHVSKQIIEKLNPQPPTRESVDRKLKQIAEKHDIVWEPGVHAEDGMPAIVSHRNEYTIEFNSKPFGMEWTGTEDGLNLYVSDVTPQSQAARAGVVLGSMLVALNGIDIQNLGSPSIHEKASTLGLPLRVTFRKPATLEPPKNKQDFSIRKDIVNKCVSLLKDPQCWEQSDKQKTALCEKQGANAAEIASALFLASYVIEQQTLQVQEQNLQQQQQQHMMQQPMPMQYPMQYPMQFNQQQPMFYPQGPDNMNNNDFNSNNNINSNNNNYNNNNYNNDNYNNNNYNNSNQNNDFNQFQKPNNEFQKPINEFQNEPSHDGDNIPQQNHEVELDDLEARFAALRKGN